VSDHLLFSARFRLFGPVAEVTTERQHVSAKLLAQLNASLHERFAGSDHINQ
jgi:hypothetical protein